MLTAVDKVIYNQSEITLLSCAAYQLRSDEIKPSVGE